MHLKCVAHLDVIFMYIYREGDREEERGGEREIVMKRERASQPDIGWIRSKGRPS